MGLRILNQESTHQNHASALVAPATVKGAAVKCEGFKEALIVMNIGTATATGTLNVKVQDSPTTDDADFDDIVDAAFPEITTANDNQTLVGSINLEKTRGYIRTVAVIGTDDVPFGVSIMLCDPDYSDRSPVPSFAI